MVKPDAPYSVAGRLSLGALTTMLEKIGIEREKKDLEFVMANGQRITRSVEFAVIQLDKPSLSMSFVFVEKGGLLLLGARALEGLSLAVDPGTKKLVASSSARRVSQSP